jgi:hypothetical protein
MGKWYDEARRMKPFYRKGAQTLSDQEALQVKGIYPTWEECVEKKQIDTNGETGYKFTYNGDLYSCINPDPTFQADWIPGIPTASLYTRIDETHAGTYEDPIPYDGNMVLEQGKYYSQDDVIYICTRDSGIALTHPLSVLVGQYVEIATE